MMSLFLPAESSDRLECGGRCGIPDCTSVFATSKALAQHVKLAKLPQCRYVSVHLCVYVCVGGEGRAKRVRRGGEERGGKGKREEGGVLHLCVCVEGERAQGKGLIVLVPEIMCIRLKKMHICTGRGLGTSIFP